MKKVSIIWNELYPIYRIAKAGLEIELTDDEYNEFKEVYDKFFSLQKIIDKKVEEKYYRR